MLGSWHISQLSCVSDVKYKPKHAFPVYCPNFHLAIDGLVFVLQHCDRDSPQQVSLLKIGPSLFRKNRENDNNIII